MNEKYIIEIRDILLSNDLKKEEKLDILSNYHASDIADSLEEMTEEERLSAYKIFDIDDVAEIFTYYENVDKYVDELTPDVTADILEAMDSEEAKDILDELEDDDKKEIIELMEAEQKEVIQKLDKYDESEVGSYLSNNYIVIDKNFTIQEAMKTLIKEAGEHDNFQTLFATDNGKFYGSIDLKDLIIARKEDKLIDICKTNYPTFFDDDLMEECLDKMRDYYEDIIPVIDHNMEIVGVITSDVLQDAKEEQFEEDYAKLGGLTDNEEMDESVRKSVAKRIPWLIILLALGFAVSAVVGAFEGIIATLPVIVFFQSIILDMAGNVGTQSLAVTIRNISNNDLDKKDIARGIFKEIRIGLVNGLIIASISFVFVFLFLLIRHQEVISGNGFVYLDSIKVSVIISISMIIATTISSLTGSLFPIILNKIHIDPAVASGPFITTLNDVFAIFLYYGLAYLSFVLFL